MFGSHILACLVPGLHNVWCLFQGEMGEEMGHKHSLHFGRHTQRVSLTRTTGWVQLGFALNMCVCVWSVDTLCVYTKLTFHLYHARHTCSIFTVLWCGCSAVKLTFYLHQTPSWLWLVINGYLTCVHPPGYGRTYQSTQWYK